MLRLTVAEESLSKRTIYENEDVLENFCMSAHYLAYAEVGRRWKRITDSCLPVYEFYFRSERIFWQNSP